VKGVQPPEKQDESDGAEQEPLRQRQLNDS
jgi:hypothetical protein